MLVTKPLFTTCEQTPMNFFRVVRWLDAVGGEPESVLEHSDQSQLIDLDMPAISDFPAGS